MIWVAVRAEEEKKRVGFLGKNFSITWFKTKIEKESETNMEQSNVRKGKIVDKMP